MDGMKADLMCKRRNRYLFLEIGNGNTLSNMIKRMGFKEELSAISLSSIKQIETYYGG